MYCRTALFVFRLTQPSTGTLYLVLRLTLREEGVRALAKGWAPTLVGYSMQGLCKFGFYEVFKVLYSNMLGEVRN